VSAAFSYNQEDCDKRGVDSTVPNLTLSLSKNLLSQASQIILTKQGSSANAASTIPNLRQWVNIYPHQGLIAIGDSYENYPTHDRVDEGLKAQLLSENLFSGHYNLSDPVAGFRDGNKYIVRIDGLNDSIFKDYSSSNAQIASGASERIKEQLLRYEAAIRLATLKAEESGGKVILQADLESQQLIAKVLGRLHQVDRDYLNVGPEGLRKKIQSFGGLPHIYDNNKGTRYFFLNDLESFAQNIAKNESQEEIQRTLSELVHFLTDRNPQGYRHGKPFLVEPNGKKVVLNEKVYQDFAKEVEKAFNLVSRDASAGWETVRVSSSLALVKSIEALKEVYPYFHSIDLDSSEFVNLFCANLQRSSSKLDLGEEFSTPLSAQELGRFAIDKNGERVFEVLTEDLELTKLANWLASNQGGDDLADLGAAIRPSEADYITCYTPDTPLTFEPHPTEFVKRYGHLEPRSYVIEFGRAGDAPERWVIEENVWSSENWQKRNTRAARELINRFSTAELSIAVKQVKDDQQRLLGTLLADPSAQLAEEYQWRTIPSPQESLLHLYNYRIRRFVPGKRADDIRLSQLNALELAKLMDPLGHLIAAGIIGQLPHLPRRDTIVNTTPEGRSTLTLLGPGESFCHSHRSKSISEYLNDFVPQMYGNLIAQWLLPVSRATSDFEAEVRSSTRRTLLKQCLKAMRKALKSATSRDTTVGREFRDKIEQIYERQTRLRGKDPLPKELNLATFLSFTEKILRIGKEDIGRISARIARATMKELALIDRLAPPALGCSSIDQWSAVEECSTAASSLIERHLPEAKKFRRTIDLLNDISTQYDLLSVREKAWFISILDVGTRAKELGMRSILATLVKGAISESANERDFYRRYTGIGEDLDLPYEAVVAYYRAVIGLKTALQNEKLRSGAAERRKQLRTAIRRLL
jgi:hypothetical protein